MAKKDTLVFSHWYHLTENFQQSTQEFYSGLEQMIKKRNLPDVRISRIDFKEGNIFSAQREYLRVKRKELVFDICAAPFGNCFFISWWLGEKMGTILSLLLVIPFLGSLVAKTSRPATYYRLDTTLMFQESVHLAVLEMLDGLTEAKGLRALSESERKPIISDLFKR
ncbi:MAG: hypothetical protein ACYC49_00385 [Ignavibacteriaceae bacterium]